MRDQDFITHGQLDIEALGMKLAPLTIEVPTRHDLNLAIQGKLQSRPPRRRRRPRPASDRFHGEFSNLPANIF